MRCYLVDDGNVSIREAVEQILNSNVINRNCDLLIRDVEPIKRSDFIITGVLTFCFEDFILIPGAAFKSVEARFEAAPALARNYHLKMVLLMVSTPSQYYRLQFMSIVRERIHAQSHSFFGTPVGYPPNTDIGNRELLPVS